MAGEGRALCLLCSGVPLSPNSTFYLGSVNRCKFVCLALGQCSCDKKLVLIFPDIFPGVTTASSRWPLRVGPLAIAVLVVCKMEDLLLRARNGVKATCVLYWYNFMRI